MRIVVDAMGSDACPSPDVAGAVLAAREYGDTIVLVGDEPRVRAELAKHGAASLPLEVVHAGDAVRMDDQPSTVGKAKPESSMHVGMRLVRDGKADAFVTLGNTGAALAIATLYTLRRIPGVMRPALSSIIPMGHGVFIMLDIGANADVRPEWLAQFALMGAIYARQALGLPEPRVGLLSNGEEEGKGSELVREAHGLISRLPLHFVGNVEPKELTRNAADVVITDGFTGNIFIKTAEATVSMLSGLIKEGIKSGPVSMVGGALIRPAIRRVYRQLDPFEIGGAPLLGVNGVVIIGHGRSNATAVKNAIRQARLAVQGGVIGAIRAGLEPVAATSNE